MSDKKYNKVEEINQSMNEIFTKKKLKKFLDCEILYALVPLYYFSLGIFINFRTFLIYYFIEDFPFFLVDNNNIYQFGVGVSSRNLVNLILLVLYIIRKYLIN